MSYLPTLVDVYGKFAGKSDIHGWYCWWKKSCTSWYGKHPIIYRVFCIPSATQHVMLRNPVNNGIFTISTGEFTGFLNHYPSTYSFGYHWLTNLSPKIPRQAGSGSGAFFAANDAARNQYLGRRPFFGELKLGWRCTSPSPVLGAGFKYCLFSPLLGEDFQFD